VEGFLDSIQLVYVLTTGQNGKKYLEVLGSGAHPIIPPIAQ